MASRLGLFLRTFAFRASGPHHVVATGCVVDGRAVKNFHYAELRTVRCVFFHQTNHRRNRRAREYWSCSQPE